MRILVLGAAGMLGRKLVARLARDGALGGVALSHLTAFDVIAPTAPADAPFPIETVTGDVAAPTTARALVKSRPDVIFHLAAVVSGEAETDFDKGYRINLDGTRHLFEAIRAAGEAYCPRVVFASSIAVFGAPFPDIIPDDHHRTPQTSYGTQKAIAELLVSDYSRRGIFDGIALRLPTIVIRPGTPNKAASGFFSNILREPLNGETAVLPVADDVRHWIASPRAATGFFIHAATLDLDRVGADRALTLPGIAVTVGGMIEALQRVAGHRAVALIHRAPDPFVAEIVAAWPTHFEPRRALDLGFEADATVDAILTAHIEDELGGRIGGASASTKP